MHLSNTLHKPFLVQITVDHSLIKGFEIRTERIANNKKFHTFPEFRHVIQFLLIKKKYS